MFVQMEKIREIKIYNREIYQCAYLLFHFAIPKHDHLKTDYEVTKLTSKLPMNVMQQVIQELGNTTLINYIDCLSDLKVSKITEWPT